MDKVLARFFEMQQDLILLEFSGCFILVIVSHSGCCMTPRYGASLSTWTTIIIQKDCFLQYHFCECSWRWRCHRLMVF